jgi:hypothetical protein
MNSCSLTCKFSNLAIQKISTKPETSKRTVFAKSLEKSKTANLHSAHVTGKFVGVRIPLGPLIPGRG